MAQRHDDEAGDDAKLICVLEGDPLRDRERVADISDLPQHLLDEIAHFFKVYKDLEPGKSTEPGYFEGRDAALVELEECKARYLETPHGH